MMNIFGGVRGWNTKHSPRLKCSMNYVKIMFIALSVWGHPRTLKNFAQIGGEGNKLWHVLHLFLKIMMAWEIVVK